MGTYHTDTRELVIPERGRIAVTADSVHRIFKLPNRGKQVVYQKTPDSVDFISKQYGLKGKDMKGKADDKFLRAWLIAAMSCLLCPTTSLHVSPRCYPNFINLDDVVNINFCQFVADKIHESCLNLGENKNSAKCFVYHLLILYIDSLDIDEPVSNFPVRAEAWTTELINKVLLQDSKADGGYGKLNLKATSGAAIDTGISNNDSLFKGLVDAEIFVSSKLPPTYNPNKKRKIAIMVEQFCTDISQKLGKFVEGIGELHDEETKESNEEAPKKIRRRKGAAAKHEKNEGASDLVRPEDLKDAQDRQVANPVGEDAAEEDDDKKKDEGGYDDDDVAGDDHRGTDTGDDDDGGQGGQANTKDAGKTDCAKTGSWLRNSTMTNDGIVASPSKSSPGEKNRGNFTL